MAIHAIAKRRLAFRKADGSFITVLPGDFATLPDEVEKDPMYRWAIADGVLVVSDKVRSAGADLPKEEASVEAEKPAPEETTVQAEQKPEKNDKGKSGKGKGKK